MVNNLLHIDLRRDYDYMLIYGAITILYLHKGYELDLYDYVCLFDVNITQSADKTRVVYVFPWYLRQFRSSEFRVASHKAQSFQ